MANLSQFSQQDIYLLLNHEKIDASNGALLGGGGTLEPDSTNRLILIGIGGTGVSTINKVKGVISKRMKSTWQNYIAFLALDTDWEELRQAKNLTQLEKFMYTQENVTRRYESRGTYPDAAHQFMPDGYPDYNAAVPMGNLNARGANRERLVGMAKLHDKAAGAAMGVDEQIVHKLRQIAARMPLTAGHGYYEVYVVGSGSGGTCSGAFVDMPALIREAIPGVHVYSMLYLPDAMLGSLPSDTHARVKANGYATLKELNYYQGVEMRGMDYPARWGFNGSQQELVIQKKFFDIPYLVGSPAGGAAASANQGARQAIAEFLISLVAKMEYNASTGGVFMTDSFLANADTRASWDNRPNDFADPSKEQKNTYHNFPKAFAAMGFAKATAPEELVRAYQAKLICENAGIKPLTEEEWNHLPPHKKPFRHPEHTMNYTEAENYIKTILEPLDKLLDDIHLKSFDYRALGGNAEMTFEQALADTSTAMMDADVERQTNQDKLNELKNKIEAAYEQYEQNVRAFIKEEGPYAFENLYKGFYKPNGNQSAVGIGARLDNLVNGKYMNGTACPWTTVEAAENMRVDARNLLNAAPNGIIAGVMARIFATRQTEARNEWLKANTELGNAKIIAKRRNYCLKEEGYFNTYFVMRAAKLTDDLKAFGNLLTALSDTYAGHGKNMMKYEYFRDANKDETHVNAAAISNTSYEWLKKKAEVALTNLQAKAFRDSLVDHFFCKDDRNNLNRTLWLDVPDNLISRENNQLKLLTEDGAIPARELFDKLVAESVPNTVSVKIQDLFEMLKSQGENYDDIAARMVDELYSKSLPRFNADSQKKIGTQTHRYIVYPENMSGEEGEKIKTALRNAARAKDSGIECYSSHDADGIMFYQQEVGLEAHMLKDIKDWELHYELELAKQTNRLHGKSPDTQRTIRDGKVYFKETVSWGDYPALSACEDPEKPDAITHQVSKEGQRRIKIRQIVEEAKELGVLYSQPDPFGNWSVYRVWCDYHVKEWKFNLMQLPQEEGLFPLGKPLAESVAIQNGRSLDMGKENSMVRVVRLDHAGLLSQAHSDENVAWEYATRTLFENVQMYGEVLDTLKLFRDWAKQIREFNDKAKKRLRPAMMAYLMKTKMMFRLPDGQWKLKHPNGHELMVTNLSEEMLEFSFDGAKQMIDNKLLGYYLFKIVDSMLPGDQLNKACLEGVQNMKNLVAAQDMESLKNAKQLVQDILVEREYQITQGVRPVIGPLDEKRDPIQKYVNFLAEIGIDQGEAKAVELFYSRVGTVEKLMPNHFK